MAAPRHLLFPLPPPYATALSYDFVDRHGCYRTRRCRPQPRSESRAYKRPAASRKWKVKPAGQGRAVLAADASDHETARQNLTRPAIDAGPATA